MILVKMIVDTWSKGKLKTRCRKEEAHAHYQKMGLERKLIRRLSMTLVKMIVDTWSKGKSKTRFRKKEAHAHYKKLANLGVVLDIEQR